MIQERNKHHHLVNLMAWEHEAPIGANGLSAPDNQQHDRDHDDMIAAREHHDGWSDKVGFVRNRLNRKKRKSKDRWNRFAGTSGGGGRGR